MSTLEDKLIAWFESPTLRIKGWAARLFWHPGEDGSPYGRLRVDARELEVLFATLLEEPSEFKTQLNDEQNGRGSFLSINARRHELPLLKPAQ